MPCARSAVTDVRGSWLAVVIALADPDDGCLGAFDAEVPSDPSKQLAQALWARECADCHGLSGAADGRLSATIEPRPPNFIDPCRPISDQWAARVIIEGAASYNGSPAMREHHALEGDPAVLAALVRIVQDFRATTACEPKPSAPAVTPAEFD